MPGNIIQTPQPATVRSVGCILSFFEFDIRIILDLAVGFSCLLCGVEPFVEGVCRVILSESGAIEDATIFVVDERYAGYSVL